MTMSPSRRRSKCLWGALAAALALIGSPVTATASSSTALCSNCPARIPDGIALTPNPPLLLATATLPANSCGGAAPNGGVEVRIDLLHSHIGDLTLRLTPPGGTQFALLDAVRDGTLSCAGDDLRGSFVSDIDGLGVAPSCGVRIPSLGGLLRPVSSDLTGLASSGLPGGTYTLEIADGADGGEGLLRGWQLYVYCEKFGVIFRDEFDD